MDWPLVQFCFVTTCTVLHLFKISVTFVSYLGVNLSCVDIHHPLPPTPYVLHENEESTVSLMTTTLLAFCWLVIRDIFYRNKRLLYFWCSWLSMLHVGLSWNVSLVMRTNRLTTCTWIVCQSLWSATPSRHIWWVGWSFGGLTLLIGLLFATL